MVLDKSDARRRSMMTTRTLLVALLINAWFNFLPDAAGLQRCRVTAFFSSVSRTLKAASRHSTKRTLPERSRINARSLQALTDDSAPSSTSQDYEIKHYHHKGWKISYRYQPASPGYETFTPIVFIHPVGIGLASWFWNRMFASASAAASTANDNGGHPELYAVDLIGCGLKLGADGWDPQARGLFFPKSWADGIRTLWKAEIQRPCVLVVQGAVTPVGIALAVNDDVTVDGATFDGSYAIDSLVFASPPIYDDLSSAIPEAELSFNYNVWSNPIVSSVVFGVFEQRSIIRFFSNMFLFEEKCDEEWLDYAMEEATCNTLTREPVKAFNAGLLNHVSYETELQTIIQTVICLCGTGDRRTEKRKRYETEMRNCRIQTIRGGNVLPWENPTETLEIIKSLCRDTATAADGSNRKRISFSLKDKIEPVLKQWLEGQDNQFE